MFLRDVDLNLLVMLDALLRERNVTRAAHVVGTSQPAMSAALARLRTLLGDELLVRVGRDYQLTPLARDMFVPLQTGLATLRTALECRTRFDPCTSTREFKIAASDYTFAVLGPKLLAHFSEVAPSVRLCLLLADPTAAGKLASGQLDLSIQPSGGMPNMPAEMLFKDGWVCAVWSSTKVSDPMTLAEWSAFPHICFTYGDGELVLTDMLLGPLAEMRKCQVLSESIIALPLILPGTRLIAVLPSRIGELFARNTDIRLVRPPKRIPAFTETMTWNPMCNDDPAHVWLRQQLKLVAAEHLQRADVNALRAAVSLVHSE